MIIYWGELHTDRLNGKSVYVCMYVCMYVQPFHISLILNKQKAK